MRHLAFMSYALMVCLGEGGGGGREKGKGEDPGREEGGGGSRYICMYG